MGIINNEKYKGDILLGKTFTVDSISKRTLENLGEEDRFYIKNHHEPIVSEETFARAQEIRERRNGGRKKGVAPGKREKFSRQYAFSCMLECGFCGANLSRRRWHSSSKYTKTIWQCVESTKHGKRFCPDYLYMRPLLNPMGTIKYNKVHKKVNCGDSVGIQLTGVEFFNVNRYVDFLLDIYSVKIYFCTEFFDNDEVKSNNMSYYPLNYLDFTNPNGEGLIINTYNAKNVAVYINDVLIPTDKLMYIYHLLRRRKYYWSWYDENNISKNEIMDYLRTNSFYKEDDSKLYFLCEEMNLIYKGELTLAGKSLTGRENMGSNKNIDYILDEVLLRGYDDKSNESNDFLLLIQKKEFKDLIALELYEYYFWNERHEFDLQLLKEIVDSVCNYFNSPEVMRQIEVGVLQTLPSAIIISMVTTIWSKMKKLRNKKNAILDEENSWMRIERNIRKIDKEFSNHDYILSDDMERIFEASREEIQPLLKLCGCKCFLNKKRSIWIKAGTKEERIREILKNNKFKYK